MCLELILIYDVLGNDWNLCELSGIFTKIT